LPCGSWLNIFPFHGPFVLCRVTVDLIPFNSGYSSTARTTRKPTKSEFVSHQMLCGFCGSSLIQVLSEPLLEALRHSFAFSSHEPPRATCEKRYSVGLFTGHNVALSAGNCP